MPWNYIGYVGSALTLVAFIVAAAASIYRRSIISKENLIKEAPESERAELIQNTLEGFNVNKKELQKLTKQQLYNLAMEQIRQNERKYKTRAIVITIIAVLLAVTSGLAFYKPNDGNSNVDPSIKTTNSITNGTNPNTPLTNESTRDASDIAPEGGNSSPDFKINRIKVVFTTTEDKNEDEAIQITIRHKTTNEVLGEKTGDTALWEVGTKTEFDIKLKSLTTLKKCNELLIEIKKPKSYHKWAATLFVEGIASDGQAIRLKPDNEFINLKGDGFLLKNGLSCM